MLFHVGEIPLIDKKLRPCDLDWWYADNCNFRSKIIFKDDEKENNNYEFVCRRVCTSMFGVCACVVFVCS